MVIRATTVTTMRIITSPLTIHAFPRMHCHLLEGKNLANLALSRVLV
jgi:hypothetical protein